MKLRIFFSSKWSLHYPYGTDYADLSICSLQWAFCTIPCSNAQLQWFLLWIEYSHITQTVTSFLLQGNSQKFLKNMGLDCYWRIQLPSLTKWIGKGIYSNANDIAYEGTLFTKRSTSKFTNSCGWLMIFLYQFRSLLYVPSQFTVFSNLFGDQPRCRWLFPWITNHSILWSLWKWTIIEKRWLGLISSRIKTFVPQAVHRIRRSHLHIHILRALTCRISDFLTFGVPNW